MDKEARQMQQRKGALPGSGNRPLGIRWIVDSVHEEAERSPIASMRYRVLLPAKALAAEGHRVDLVRAQDLAAGRLLDWQGVDVLVIGKLFLDPEPARFGAHSHQMLRAAATARAAGTTVVADINDDHFDKPGVGQHWKALATLADVCIVGSPAMGALVARHTTRPVVPVGDPVGSPKAPPRVYADRAGNVLSRLFRKEPLKLVWYGAADNVPPMVQWAMFIGAAWKEMPLLLRIVSRPHKVIDSLCADFERRHGPNARIEFLPWSEEGQWAIVGESDVVLIPTDLADPRKAVKSANRLVDALFAGRHVIASAIPSYQPYAEFACLTTNPVQALHDYLNDPTAARRRIATGQAAVEHDWGLAAVAQHWLQAFGATTR